MPKNNAVLIFDLDETILSVNSFPFWVFYLLIGKFGGLSFAERVSLRVQTLLTMAKRKLLRISHQSTKQQLQKLWQKALAKDPSQLALRNLTELLQSFVRPNMQDILRAVATQEYDAVLATAAVSDYAETLGNILGFTHIIATPSNAAENVKAQKRDNVLAWLATKQWNDRTRVFFTDHLEDAPLIRECQAVLWFGKDADVTSLRSLAPTAQIIPCSQLSSSDIRALL